MGRPLYEAVPDDVDIVKLTLGQRDALARHKRHENINTFLGNEATPKLLLGGLAIASLPVILPIIISALAKQATIDPELAQKIDTVIFIKDLNEAIGEIIVPGGGILFKGEARDFWDKYVKK